MKLIKLSTLRVIFVTKVHVNVGKVTHTDVLIAISKRNDEGAQTTTNKENETVDTVALDSNFVDVESGLVK